MPIIQPFQGFRYDAAKIGSLSRVVTPPYDVISPEAQLRYYHRHPQNFIRVVYGRGYRSDARGRDRYSRARRTLGQWIRQEILRQDPEPSVYPYLQEYPLGDRRHRRWGVIALVRLDSPRIYPHEEIREGPKQDRLRLMEAVGASLSQIFGLIPDLSGRYQGMISSACRARRPVAVAHLERVKHSLWRISDPAWIARLQQLLRPKELLIADGHHRFEAAVAYRNRRRKQEPIFNPSAPYNFSMFYLAAAGPREPGLLPTHRLLKRFPPDRRRRLLEGGLAPCSVRPTANLEDLVARLERLQARGRLGVGLYTGNGGYLLEPLRPAPNRLDVEWLHREILPRCAGSEPELSYTQDLAEACRRLREKKAQALFVLRPFPLRAVLERARRGPRLPRKTTYFYPKPLAGLVEYKF